MTTKLTALQPRHNQRCPCHSHRTVGGIPEQCTCGLDALQADIERLEGERDDYASLNMKIELENDLLELLLETAQAQLETVRADNAKLRKALELAQTDIHNAYCEGDEEGNWDHVPRCGELEALKGSQ